MDIIITKNISIADYKRLIKSADWKELSEKQIKKALENSMCVVIAKEKNKVVGMARLIGDYGTHGLIADVVVLPNYQNKQIGSQLVLKIKDYVFDFLGEDEQFLIELCPAYGKRNFYQRLGFKYKPTNMDGMYLWIKKGKENE